MFVTHFNRQSGRHLLPRPRLALLAAAFALVTASGGGTPVAMANASTVPSTVGTTPADEPVLPMGPNVPTPTPTPTQLPATATVAPPSAESEVTAAVSFHDGSDLELVPPSALAAYQRTEVVMADAMRSCRLDWTLLAAVGQVLTDHGRQDGEHEIDDEGKVSPAIVGAAIRDTRGRRLDDSDGGDLDGTRRHDRAVGPMLLAPAAWRDIGVDGDADGERDPQDIDDAALATAVLLCVDGENLQRPRQLEKALTDLNDDEEFLPAVLEVAEAYETDAATIDPFPVFAGPAVTYVSAAMPVAARPTVTEKKAESTAAGTSGDDTTDTSFPGKPKTEKSGTSEPKQGKDDSASGQTKDGTKGGTKGGSQQEPAKEDPTTEQPADSGETDQGEPAEPTTPVEPVEEPAEEPEPVEEPEPEPEPAPEPEPEPEPKVEEAPPPKEETPAPAEKPVCDADGVGTDAVDEELDPACPEATDEAESTEPTGA